VRHRFLIIDAQAVLLVGRAESFKPTFVNLFIRSFVSRTLTTLGDSLVLLTGLHCTLYFPLYHMLPPDPCLDQTPLSLHLLVSKRRLSLFGKGAHSFLLIGRREQLLEQSTFESETFVQGEFVG
jgi:hypothetical protein